MRLTDHILIFICYARNREHIFCSIIGYFSQKNYFDFYVFDWLFAGAHHIPDVMTLSV